MCRSGGRDGAGWGAIGLDGVAVVGMLAGMSALAVFLGSGFGGLARWWMTAWITHRAGTSFPWGTLWVNVSGSLLIGVLAGLTGADERVFARTQFREFFVIGLCGGYTTFSSFSLQTLQLAERGEAGRALTNVAGSVVLCLAAVWLGHAVMAWFAGVKGR